MENKEKIEKFIKVSKEILEVFKNNNINPNEMNEILDNLKFSITASILEVMLKNKENK